MEQHQDHPAPEPVQLPSRREAKLEYLHDSQLFAQLTDEQMRAVEQATAMTHCERGRVFFSPEDIPGTVYVLKAGNVRLFRREHDGRELTVAMLDSGSVFGESSLLGQSHAGVFAQAIEDCVLCVIGADRMHALIHEFPQIGLNLLVHVGAQLRRSQELSQEMAYWSVQRRLGARLRELADRYGHPTLDGHVIIERRFTQSELAEMVGASRQTVSELMGVLAHRGIIETRRRRTVVLDARALAQFGDAREGAAPSSSGERV